MGISQIIETEDGDRIRYTAITEDGNSHTTDVHKDAWDSHKNEAKDKAIEEALYKDKR